MLRPRRISVLFPPRADSQLAERLTTNAVVLLAPLVMMMLVATTAGAQSSGAPGTPLHLPANRFEFVAAGDSQPPMKPLRVHNGGAAPFTDVRLTRLTYADSARGSTWLVAVPRQTVVAPDELATVGTLCVDASGLAPGTYHAKAGVSAREVPEPVAVTITLIVTDAAARTRAPAVRCGTTSSK